MPNKMLIDATHPEETRVVVLRGHRVEEFDFESASRKQLRGNIYLAKVTRVEPSLQAAFVDYGGNRHGFLAFSEIHPDYYQIPVADRERLLAEEAALREAEMAEATDAEADEADVNEAEGSEAAAAADGPEIQEVGGDDDDDIERRPLRQTHRSYKIQEVVKRRQIMLVQVAKEERGSKGAALTTYLSLAGRYCVLMPNTVRGGGISRKIGNITDRKRLKKILAELDVPEGMAVIVRTAGLGRSKAEIKRDYDYMMRLWSNIREVTLKSTAPTLVYEEGNLIKRSLRDLYERDIEEILIQGEPEYKVAREFMKLFIPSHAKRVKLFTDPLQPLFQAYRVEDQLDAMHQPVVQLRSGGYVVLNATEALISIDVNSGRSTRERHIEETALRTNLEAADEIARQLRLRDLAGLIVIDFIDMENARNQGLVERRMKEAMKGDRARTQIGRISPFGLLELSRQRLRPSLLETSFEQCPHCHGMGVRRTTESTALAVLRKLEDEGQKQRASEIFVTMQPGVANYLLNQKRRSLAAIEERLGMSVSIVSDAALSTPEYRIERARPVVGRSEDEAVADAAEEGEEAPRPADREDAGKRGRRRRGRRRRRDEEQPAAGDVIEEEVVGEEMGADEVDDLAAAPADDDEEDEDLADEAAEDAEAGRAEAEADAAAESGRKRRRRGKRGGRRRSRRPAGDAGIAEAAASFEEPAADAEMDAAGAIIGEAPEVGEAAISDDAAVSGFDDAESAGDEEAGAVAADSSPAIKPSRRRARGRSPRQRARTGEPAAIPKIIEAIEAVETIETIEIVEAGETIEVTETAAAPEQAEVLRSEEEAASTAMADSPDAGADAETPPRPEELVAAHGDDTAAGDAVGGDAGEHGRETPVHALDHGSYEDDRERSHDSDDSKENERPRRGWWQRLIT
jgi:ribonuclease E